MTLLAIQPLGRNRDHLRLWIESRRLEQLGFSHGTPLEIKSQSETLTLRPAVLGENHVSSRVRFSPGLMRISDFRRAWRNTRGRGDIPERASITGRAKSSKVTMVETGLPGSPKKYLCGTGAKTSRAGAGAPAPHEHGMRPNTTGRPG